LYCFFNLLFKTGKIIKRAGSLILGGGSFAVGERVSDRSLDGVKGIIPANS